MLTNLDYRKQIGCDPVAVGSRRLDPKGMQTSRELAHRAECSGGDACAKNALVHRHTLPIALTGSRGDHDLQSLAVSATTRQQAQRQLPIGSHVQGAGRPIPKAPGGYESSSRCDE